MRRTAADNPAWRRMRELQDGTAEQPAPRSDFDAGETITVFERTDRDRLRLARKTFNGRAFIDLRVEFRGEHGDWLPTKKGVSIKAREIGRLADALAKLAEESAR